MDVIPVSQETMITHHFSPCSVMDSRYGRQISITSPKKKKKKTVLGLYENGILLGGREQNGNSYQLYVLTASIHQRDRQLIKSFLCTPANYLSTK